MKSIRLLMLMCLLSVAGGRIAAHESPVDGRTEHAFVVNEAGYVLLEEDVACGDVLVPSGEYGFRHRILGQRHMIVLTSQSQGMRDQIVYELTMRVLAPSEVSKRSAIVAEHVPSGPMSLTVVEVSGEGALHLPVPIRLALVIRQAPGQLLR